MDGQMNGWMTNGHISHYCYYFQTVRVQSAVSVLLRKAHLYELLASLQQSIDSVISATPISDTVRAGGNLWNIKEEEVEPSGTEGKKDEGQENENDEKMEGIENEEKEVAAAKSQPLSPELVKTISQLLTELYNMLKGVESDLMLLPPKAFPGKNSCCDKSGEDVFVGVARMLNTSQY